MTESLRALLAGAIDYAGMFPPAALSLEQALAKYREHRRGPEAWMVGRFVCPAGELSKFGSIGHAQPAEKVALIVPWAADYEADLAKLSDILAHIKSLPAAGTVDTIEFRWQGDVREAFRMLRYRVLDEIADSFKAAKLQTITIFFELPPTRASDDASVTQLKLGNFVRMFDVYNQKARSSGLSLAGFKIRCGGGTAAEIPTSGALAAVICACRDHDVFWKATAGLHHPFRHVDPELGVPIHGFVNLLTAAVMADVHQLETQTVQEILEDDDPGHFQFTNEALTCRDLSATVPQIAKARERAMRSFGSCSIDEPWQDLTVLGLV
jgi:hypothetical protein